MATNFVKSTPYLDSDYLGFVYKVIGQDCTRVIEENNELSSEIVPLSIQTGFVIEDPEIKGIITALHGIIGCKKIILSTANDSKEGFLDKVDVAKDIAVLRSKILDNLSRNNFPQRTQNIPEDSSGFFVVGYPLATELQRSGFIGSGTYKTLLKNLIPLDFENKNILRAALEKRKSPLLTKDVLKLQGNLVSGYSGAPVFDSQGQVIGIGQGGLQGGTVGIGWAAIWEGLNLRPKSEVESEIDRLKNSPVESLFAFPRSESIANLPTNIKVKLLVAEQAIIQDWSSNINVVKDDHNDATPDSKLYSERFEAKEGFLFTSANWQESSATNESGVVLNIVEGGRAIEFEYILTSGPIFDRYRGWITGTIIAQQQRMTSSAEIAAGTFDTGSRAGDYLLNIPKDLDISSIGQIILENPETGSVVARGNLGESIASSDGSFHFQTSQIANDFLLFSIFTK